MRILSRPVPVYAPNHARSASSICSRVALARRVACMGAMNMGIIAEIAVVPAVLFALLLGALSTPATAQSYPDRPLKILVGGAPGSVPDAMIRPIAEQLSVSL